MNRLRQFWHYTDKVFAPPARLRAIRNHRSRPEIPTRVFKRQPVPGGAAPRALLVGFAGPHPAPGLAAAGGLAAGPQRRRLRVCAGALPAVENRAFNELTRHYHLPHCPHPEPVAILAWLLIRGAGVQSV